MIPYNYEAWKSCIVNDCKIKLTKTFIADRLSVFENAQHPETRQFATLYGQQHLENVVHWYKRALREPADS
ncbi:MAG: hypothetical protein AAF597_17990 [Bacteroidota bacterium]